MLDLSDQTGKASFKRSSPVLSTDPELGSEAPIPGQLYRHYKGNLYRVASLVTLEAGGQPAVVYSALDPEQSHKNWVRPVREFVSPVKVGAAQVPRFSLVEEPKESALRHYCALVGLSDLVVARVKQYHQESHRFYHDWNHILGIFETAQQWEVSLSLEQVVAILYHDIVYVPGAPAGQNEQMSALLLKAHRLSLGVPFDADIACQIVLDTAEHIAHHEQSSLVLDLDLSPLAASAVIYCALNEFVWLENRHLLASMPDPRRDFDTRRLRFLLSLAERGPLFSTLHKLEEPARENLEGLRKAWVAKYGGKA